MKKSCKPGLLATLLLALTLAPLVQAQNSLMVIKRPTELREAPSEGARNVAALAANASVTRLTARQGPWVEVRNADGATGWIHMFDVVAAPPASSSSSGGNLATGAARGLTSFLGGGTRAPVQTAAATSTIGIRGLSAEDLANAQPNIAAVTQAEALRANAAQAQQFGAQAALTTHTVPALPVPPAPAEGVKK